MATRKAKVSKLPVTPADNGGVASHLHSIPVVGIGASAGGIEALMALIPTIPVECGIAFVIVQHLDPNHHSNLSALLARHSKPKVVEMRHDTPVEADHVYVAPPNGLLALDGDLLRVTFGEYRTDRNPIDRFLQTLADSRGENAASVILSGTGSDGTQGLRAIKERGGLCIAQQSAEYDGMMRSAVNSGLVDFVLPVSDIAQKLCDYFDHLLDVKGRKDGDGVRQEAAAQLAQICALLRTRTGHDFSGYKDKTVARRVQRRMQVLQIEDVPDFIDRLRKDPQELDALLQDLLIGVTNFFRDAQAFAALEEKVIPRIFEGKTSDDTIRVWVPGCSTGEEAYSIAILLRERLAKEQSAPKLLIFASDIDEHSLQTARIGRFPAAIAKDVPQRLLDRYFVREDGTYRIASELREMCLFSSHNLLRDAPFSKLDLISCRNLLIYLTPELQNRLIPLFHYALNDGGYLFLGSSENVTRHPRLFSPVDKVGRIFQRRTQLERSLPEFPLTTPGAQRKNPVAPRPVLQQQSLQSVAERHLLDRYSPAYVVINSDGELLHASGRTGKYLELPPGVPRTDVYSMARRGLRPDLRAVVHRATTSGNPATQPNILVGTNGGRQLIDLIVQPLPTSELQDPLYMVVFQDRGGIEPESLLDARHGSEERESTGLRQLEIELQATKERLQTATEELESSNEELKSGNEELSSMNEELQSANEELETSKEELQSINEELQTVNSELSARVDELSRANSDIANLLESTQIATVFLDRDLAIKSFTPAAKDVFRLVESDAGRPITHVRSRFGSDTVQEDAERVLRTLATIERQVNSNYSDARYIMRMMPYRTIDSVIAGVVITFMDVTKIKAAEARITELTGDLQDRVQSLETLLNLVPVGIVMVEDDVGRKARINRYGAQLLGQDGDGAAPMPLTSTLRLRQNGQDIPADQQPLQRALRSGEPVAAVEAQLVRGGGKTIDVLISATPLLDENSKVRGGIAALVDISERKKSEAHQQVLLHELQHRVKKIITTIAALALRMIKGSTSLDTFAAAFQDRLAAMARAHELLSRSNWSGTGVRQLVDTALASHTAGAELPVRMSGPDVLLPPNIAATLGMVLYELATNAVKYGALSGPAGQIDVKWQVQSSGEERHLHLSWIETGGPAVTAGAKEGFGTSFITQSVAYELNGNCSLNMRSSGLQCTLDFPLPKADKGASRPANDDSAARA